MLTSYSSYTENDQCLALCSVDITNRSSSSLRGVEEVEGAVVSYPEVARAINSSFSMES